VVEACGRGDFHIYAVETIHEAIDILTGVAAGVRTADGDYPEGTVLAQAVARADAFWRRTLRSPQQFTSVEPAAEEDEVVFPQDPL